MTQDNKIFGLTAGLIAVAIIAIAGLLYVSSKVSATDSNVAKVVAYLQANEGVTVGASGTRYPNGLSTDSTSPNAGQIRGTTLTITDDITASKSAFCIDGYATSTQTPVAFAASTTATIEGVDGVLVYTFGACP